MAFELDFEPVGRRVNSEAGKTLLAAAQAAGIELTAVCGGAGTCAGCRIRLVRGRLSAPTPEERAALTTEELSDGLRLACQCAPLEDCRLEIPPESLSAPQRLQLEDSLFPLSPAPLSLDPSYGLAVDLGTTKLAAFLVELNSGRTLARAGAMNPQIAYGEDVVSRIVYANSQADGAAQLRRRTAAALNEMIANLCAEAGLRPEQIEAAAVVGNTVMHHLFAGLPVAQLGVAPYQPAQNEALTLPAGESGLAIGPTAPVYLPPLIAGYVGADHVAALLAVNAASSGLRPPSTVLLLDIGTNTEISLQYGERLWCCSCASGPAFEGAHIHDGMRAAPGAIERLQIRGGGVHVHTIGGQPAIGICGSGILDAVAELWTAGALERAGSFVAGHPLVSGEGRNRAAILVSAEHSGHGREVVVTRKDVNEIQLAKAAIRAGTEILLQTAGISAAEVEEFIIAGAFGAYLDIRSAVRIGMFPTLPLARFRQVGNAAGAGARRLLADAAARQQAEALARQVEYVELSTHPGFRQEFANALMLTE